MPLDPIEQIRAAREQIMKEFDYDLDKLCDFLAAQRKDEDREYVTPKPKRLRGVARASTAISSKNGKSNKLSRGRVSKPSSAKKSSDRKRSG